MEQLEDRRLLTLNTLLSFPGEDQATAGPIQPPDTVGDVGPDHYIQMVNALDGAHYTVYDKDDGSLITGPIRLGSLSSGALCANGLGDPIVLYDELADRWILTEFAAQGNGLCVYVSKTSDPVANMAFPQDNFYAYEFETLLFPDYPKYGVHPDAYFVSTNEGPPTAYALDRENMLQGLPARDPQQFITTRLPGNPDDGDHDTLYAFQSLTVADSDGDTAPPAGEPGYFMRHFDDEQHTPLAADPQRDFLELFEFDVDWEQPQNSSFRMTQRIAIQDYDSRFLNDGFAITQPVVGPGLDAIPQIIMHRLQYRNFGTHETLLGNFTVDAHGNAANDDHGGIRWFELRKDPNNPASTWSLYQEGDVAPDPTSRWMGSLAMNGAGAIALGYSVSDEVTSPGIRWTGRTDDDPMGQMFQGEVNLLRGDNFFLGFRWGDYSAMTVDPVDDDTFWFTTQYTTNSEWATQIFSLQIVDDTPPPPEPPEVTEVTIRGVKYNDLDGSGSRDPGEPVAGNFRIYVDFDGDGRFDLGEPTARTDIAGRYEITVDRPGTFFVREVERAGWIQTEPGAPDFGHEVVVPDDGPEVIFDFGNQAARDHGDAPESYATLREDNGPVHPILVGFNLGEEVDSEMDGIPTDDADGDDLNQLINDEDGVVFTSDLAPGFAATVDVTVETGDNSAGRLNAWVDFNRNGVFNPSEQIFANLRLDEGTHSLTYTVPASAQPGTTYARFRYGYMEDQTPRGADTAGEVEDYVLRILSETPEARDDEFTVLQNSTANTLDVLANDVTSINGPIFIADTGPTSNGGRVTISATARTLSYTPAAGFFGTETFTYRIEDQVEADDTATVTVQVLPALDEPQAIDDSFEVLTTDTNVALDVLANDLSGQDPPIGIFDFATLPSFGSAFIDRAGTSDPGDDVIRYTPGAVTPDTGTDQFSYIIEDALGVQSTATVTVHVVPTSLVNDVVDFRIQTSDLTGTAITAASVGQPFLLQVFVDDLRAPFPLSGVGAGYLDVLYDLGFVSIAGDVIPGNDYLNAASGDASLPGLIDEAGGFQTGLLPLGPDEVLLFSVPMTANAIGTATFKGDPADDLPDNATVLFEDPDQPGGGPRVVDLQEQRFTNTTLNIVGAGGLPLVIDDTFAGPNALPVNASNVMLDVLANDVEETNPPLTIFSVGVVGDLLPGESVTTNADDTMVVYTAPSAFSGTRQLIYTASNATGLSASATVTVEMGSTPKDVTFDVRTTNLAGAPISSIAVGQEFLLEILVEDSRTGVPADDMGVFAAYMDVLINSSLVSTVPELGSALGFEVMFGDNFNRNGLSGSDDRPNIVDEFGAFQNFDVPFEPLGPGPFPLAAIKFTADAAGTANFVLDPADLLPQHETLLFEPPSSVPFEDIFLDATSITITNGGGEGEFPYTNPVNRFDVNDDSFITPVDALLVINATNALGMGNLPNPGGSGGGEGEASGLADIGYIDVDRDMALTSMDVLTVINVLNSGGMAEGEAAADLSGGEGEFSPTPSYVGSASSSSGTSTVPIDRIVLRDHPERDGIWGGTQHAYRSPISTDAVFARWTYDGAADSSPASDDVIDDIYQGWSDPGEPLF
jgi:hypothetical protein